MTTNPNDAAFADDHLQIGLTKREWFAGLALAAIISGSWAADTVVTDSGAAQQAVNSADALIAELNRLTPDEKKQMCEEFVEKIKEEQTK